MGDQLRFVDDSGDTRLAGELVDDGATVGDVLTVQSDGSLAAAAGGGSSSYVVRAFPFAFDSPGILTGHTVYTPTVGDVLLDAWIQVDTAWDGTNPFGDFGTFLLPNGDPGTTGMFNDQLLGGPPSGVDMSNADTTNGFQKGILKGRQASRLSDVCAAANVTSLIQVNGAGPGLAFVQTLGELSNGDRVLPCKFTEAIPWKVVVSQSGQAGGADPGATQGSAVLYLVTATPQ